MTMISLIQMPQEMAVAKDTFLLSYDSETLEHIRLENKGKDSECITKTVIKVPSS
jgi:hypothetical protein